MIEKLLSNTKKVGDCLEWQGSLTPNGYGRATFFGVRKYVHRWAMEFTLNQTLTPKECVCHKCDNPKCCNPEHLFVGSQADNLRDMDEKGRRSTAYQSHPGESNPSCKLSTKNALDIYNCCSLSYSQLARKFGISKSQVAAIKNKQSWKHIHE